MSLKIGIAGAGGRMGQLLCAEVTAQNLTLIGGFSRSEEKNRLYPGCSFFANCEALASLCDVMIDFTHADLVQSHAEIFKKTQTAWVLGTTGLSSADEAAVAEAARSVPVVRASNFSEGVTLLLDFAERMGRLFEAETYDAEIIEMHHRQKVDAPSGTALSLAKAFAKGRTENPENREEPTFCTARSGQTGPRPVGEIGISSLRGGQIVGEHTLLLTSDREQISLTHKAFDRSMFAKGAVKAARFAATKENGLYSMFDVTGLKK